MPRRLRDEGIQYAAEDRVATAVMEVVFGSLGAKLMAGAILISTFGCVNGMLLAGRSGLLRYEPRRVVLQECWQAESKVECAGKLAVAAMGVDMPSVSLRQLRAAC